MAIILRSEKGSPLTHDQLDQNFRELIYSSSVSGSVVTLHRFIASGSTTPVVSLPTTGSVQELDNKIDSVKEEVQSEIRTLENTINSANINQETTATVTGVDTIALPKTAANTGMQVQLFGQSAENLVVNGDFRNGTTGWSFSNVTSSLLTGGVLMQKTDTESLMRMTVTGTVVTGDIYYSMALLKCSVSPSANDVMFGQFNTWLTVNSNHISYAQPTLELQVLSVRGTMDQPAIYFFTGVGAKSTYTGSISVYGVRVINLTATFGDGKEPTKEQCDILFANYFEGSDNVLGTGRVRSVGKNLFNARGRLQIYNTQVSNYPVILGSNSFRSYGNWAYDGPNGINVVLLPNTTYTLSFNAALGGNATSPYGTIVNVVTEASLPGIVMTSPKTFTTGNETLYSIRLGRIGGGRDLLGWCDYTNVQIEKGSTVTTFEQYRPSSLYLTTPELRSNGLIKDEIRKGTNGYELVKRVGVGTLGAELILNGGFDSEADWELTNATISNGTMKGSGLAGELSRGFQSKIITAGKMYRLRLKVIAKTGTLYYLCGGDLTVIPDAAIGKYYETTIIATENETAVQIIKERGDASSWEVDDVSLKEISLIDGVALNSQVTDLGSNIHYTLATPVITPIPHAGPLNSNSNGTVYFEPIIADAGVYSSNLAIQLNDYPIASFESIRKYANGTYTELNTATAVIASGGLSFAHPDLSSGDLVMFTYAYANESIGRSMTLTYAISNSNPYYNITNSVPLTTGYYTSTTARAAVPEGIRKAGLILTYETAAGVWYTERYIGTATDTTSWTTAGNWEIGVLRIAAVTDTTEYAEITI